LRDSTISGTLQLLQRYVGYLIGIRGTALRQWSELFKVANVDAFVRWNAARHKVRITRIGTFLATRLCAIAQVQELSHLAALRRYKHDLPTPEPMHDKQRNAPEPDDLERTGNTLIEHARQPFQTSPRVKHPGLRHALLFERGLILKLLTRIPFRPGNVAKIRFGTNLYQDEHGFWQLEFKGEELKVGVRQRRTNKWRGLWPPDLVAELDEFIKDHRPKLPKAQNSQSLFLTQTGRPLSVQALCFNLNIALVKCVGKRFYPNWARHIYATHMLDQGLTIETVAYMMNNTPQIIHDHYYQSRAAIHYAKAQAAVHEILSKTSTKLTG
jgi:hypothetical protein